MPCKGISEQQNQLVLLEVALRLLGDMIIFYLEEKIVWAELLDDRGVKSLLRGGE